jgi:hypothetical protein
MIEVVRPRQDGHFFRGMYLALPLGIAAWASIVLALLLLYWVLAR